MEARRTATNYTRTERTNSESCAASTLLQVVSRTGWPHEHSRDGQIRIWHGQVPRFMNENCIRKLGQSEV